MKDRGGMALIKALGLGEREERRGVGVGIL